MMHAMRRGDDLEWLRDPERCTANVLAAQAAERERAQAAERRERAQAAEAAAAMAAAAAARRRRWAARTRPRQPAPQKLSKGGVSSLDGGGSGKTQMMRLANLTGRCKAAQSLQCSLVQYLP